MKYYPIVLAHSTGRETEIRFDLIRPIRLLAGWIKRKVQKVKHIPNLFFESVVTKEGETKYFTIEFGKQGAFFDSPEKLVKDSKSIGMWIETIE